MHTLLIHEATFDRLGDELKAHAASLRFVILGNDGSFREASGKVLDGEIKPTIGYGTPDVWFTRIAPKFVQTLLETDRLEWFQSSAAGLEHPILRAIGGKAEVYTNSHAQAEAIAEWVLWAGFDWLQGGPARRAAQGDKRWDRLEFREMAGTHWMVVGFGAIGRETAKRLRLLGAKVTGVRRTPGADPDADQMIRPSDMKAHLPEIDAVLLCCPHTEETEGMANAEFFAAMKTNSLFLNVGRGKLVDETALLAGLNDGKPSHATLDVVETEPLPSDNVIWTHPAITLTAHISANTVGSAHRTDQMFLKNLGRFLAGVELANIIPSSEFQTAA
ncbi:MAG: NAD(P)-dependent oxidoreductase [Pseudomonadota bacterium]